MSASWAGIWSVVRVQFTCPIEYLHHDSAPVSRFLLIWTLGGSPGGSSGLGSVAHMGDSLGFWTLGVSLAAADVGGNQQLKDLPLSLCLQTKEINGLQ